MSITGSSTLQKSICSERLRTITETKGSQTTIILPLEDWHRLLSNRQPGRVLLITSKILSSLVWVSRKASTETLLSFTHLLTLFCRSLPQRLLTYQKNIFIYTDLVGQSQRLLGTLFPRKETSRLKRGVVLRRTHIVGLPKHLLPHGSTGPTRIFGSP